jgi:uncharacterized damage-inducible protein DinB
VIEHLRLMAKYNRWMNRRLYETAGGLSEEALQADEGAYFGSLIGTLNHIVVGDLIWLRRFAAHPANHRALASLRSDGTALALDTILFRTLGPLGEERERLDAIILAWVDELTDAELDHELDYRSTRGVRSVKHFGSLVLHMFNHQTHHRGQATTLLSQQGLDMGVTDLLMLISDARQS